MHMTILQSYLDSNVSLRALPLRHSLTYLRHALLGDRDPTLPHVPAHVAAHMTRSARAMALLCTVLGAAYVNDVQSEVLTEENMEALKAVMLKVGLAGGFLQAGRSVKENVEQRHLSSAVASSSQEAGGDGPSAEQGGDAGGREGTSNHGFGSLEDLSHLLHPSAIASRLYNAVSNRDNVAAARASARNVALLCTFLGAAYVHQHGGDISLLPEYDPGEVLTEENVEALKAVMLKVGLAGGFLRAGKSVKENVEMWHNAPAAASSSVAAGDASPGASQGDNEEPAAHGEDRPSNHMNDAETASYNASGDSSSAAIRARPSRRSASLGSLEDLSHIMHPSAIASRLYNAAFPARSSSPNSSTAILDSNNPGHGSTGADERLPEEVPCVPQDASHMINPTSKKRHRSKRSHQTLRHDNHGSKACHDDTEARDPAPCASVTLIGEEKHHQDSSVTNSEEHKTDQPSPEKIAYAMEHRFSTNPYDHAPSHLVAKSQDPATPLISSGHFLRRRCSWPLPW